MLLYILVKPLFFDEVWLWRNSIGKPVTLRRKILLLILFVLILVNFWTFFGMNLPVPARQLPDPIPFAIQSFHRDGNDESWIMKVEDDGSVWVQMVDDKTNIHFRPSPGHLRLFSEHINHIADVTFECGQKPEEKCDLSKPYQLYIKNVPVEFLEIIKKAAKDP